VIWSVELEYYQVVTAITRKMELIELKNITLLKPPSNMSKHQADPLDLIY